MSKSRYWWFILYPESAPDDFIDQLTNEMVPCVISPLHDKDIHKDGTLKKPHYHILLRYDGNTTYNHVLELTRRYNATIPLIPNSPSAAFQYLTHENDPSKAHYDTNDLVMLNGFKPPRFVKSEDDVFDMTAKILAIINDNSLFEYSDVVHILMGMKESVLLNHLVKNAYFFNTYLRSLSYKNSMR